MASSVGKVVVRWADLGLTVEEIEKMADKEIRTLAFAIEAEAVNQVRVNDQVDTGFLMNSHYVAVQDEVSTYAKTMPSSDLKSRAGDLVHRERAPEAPLGKARALIAFGAVYAIWQELRRSFLYKAAEIVASRNKS